MKYARNVILISIDDLRSRCIDPTGHDSKLSVNTASVATSLAPNMTSMFCKGLFFPNCITAAPYTTASHASILSGRWPLNHGLMGYFNSRVKVDLVFEILKREGFATLFQTDFPILLGDHLGFTRGVDRYVIESEEESLAWIDLHGRTNRIAAFFHFANVHWPYGYHRMDRDRDSLHKTVHRLSKQYGIAPPGNLHKGFIEARRARDDELIAQQYSSVIDHLYRHKLYDEIDKLYLEGVRYFDARRFLDFITALRHSEVFKDSLVVLFADHGETWSDTSFGHYNSLSEDVIRVPLGFSGYGISKSQALSRQVRTVDIVPTVLDVLGIKQSTPMDGFSLLSESYEAKEFPAFTQIWLADVELLVDFMHGVECSGKFHRPSFDVRLFKESIRYQGYKLVREYEDGLVFRHLYSVKNSQLGRQDASRTQLDPSELEREIDRYNSELRKQEGGQIDVSQEDEAELLRQLRNLGYRV